MDTKTFLKLDTEKLGKLVVGESVVGVSCWSLTQRSHRVSKR